MSNPRTDSKVQVRDLLLVDWSPEEWEKLAGLPNRHHRPHLPGRYRGGSIIEASSARSLRAWLSWIRLKSGWFRLK
jgi:hypothetical protein